MQNYLSQNRQCYQYALVVINLHTPGDSRLGIFLLVP